MSKAVIMFMSPALLTLLAGLTIVHWTGKNVDAACWKNNGACWVRCTQRYDSETCTPAQEICEVTDCTGFASQQWCIINDPLNPGLFMDLCVWSDYACDWGGAQCPCDAHFGICGA
jgi:hypothetical protein